MNSIALIIILKLKDNNFIVIAVTVMMVAINIFQNTDRA